MDFLGIGPLELLFIIIIALIVLGPKDMVNVTRTIGKFLRNLVTSKGWADFRQSMQSLRNLPYKMMREAGLEEVTEDLNKDLREISQTARIPVDLSLPLANPAGGEKSLANASSSPIPLEGDVDEPHLPFDDRLTSSESPSADLSQDNQPPPSEELKTAK